MTVDQIILFSLFGAVFGLLLWGKFRYDIVAFSALLLGVVLGVVEIGDPASLGRIGTKTLLWVLVVTSFAVTIGMVMVNLPTAGVDYHVPFGGRKGSSYGAREQGRYASEFYTTVKTAYILPI